MCPPSDLASAHSTPSQLHFDIKAIIPPSDVSQSAYEHAASLLAPSILNHSIRVYLYASALAQRTSSRYFMFPTEQDLLFTACLFHDIGTTATYNSPQRFEVEGANAAVKHLSQFQISAAAKHAVWTAIAIHTSPGIAEKISELSRLVRIAVITDFGRKSEEWETLVPLREQLETVLARAEIEKVLGDAVVGQAKQRPEKAPTVSWPGVMYKAWLAEPEWEGVNKAF